jgi:V/A-type H+-transporting ATPase subunit I
VYGLVCALVLNKPWWGTIYEYLLWAGLPLAVIFNNPSRNVLRMVLIDGVASSIFPVIATLSDVISYVRLMAIGLAGSMLAITFNDMAVGIGFWPLTVLVLILGHGLNIGLCLIALFAHGVRLNILEFGNNLGMEWSGYAYEPFARKQEK